MSETGKIGLLVDDMFFASKINGAAAAAGRQVQRIKSREQLEQEVILDPPTLMIVDLNSDRVDPISAIEFLKSRPELSGVPVVGFVSHVQADLIRAAHTAGCDYVLPRSRFNEKLAEIISSKLDALPRRPHGEE